jgi:hypothetical protein
VWFTWPTFLASVVGTGCLLLSITTPTIANTTSAGTPTGALVMQESSHGHTCTSSTNTAVSLDASTCANINELAQNGPLTPGQPVTSHVRITNLGTVDARTLTLAPAGSCVQDASKSVTDLCSRITVTIISGAVTVYAGTAAALGHATPEQLRMPAAPRANQYVDFTITTTLDPHAGNQYMGLHAYVPVRWSLVA